MLYIQNNVVYSFSLSKLLCAQSIFRFYEKTEVPLLPNYLGIGFWFDAFCAKNSSEDSSSSAATSSSEQTDISSAKTLSGKVQKGPYVHGTAITVRELDSSMSPTGKTFTGTIDDNTGIFSVKDTLIYKIVELSADGYYLKSFRLSFHSKINSFSFI